MIPASSEHLRTPLGTLILRAGLLSEEQIADALREGERSGRRLGEILVQRGLLGPEDLARMLARQMGLAFVLLGDQPLDRHAVQLISEDRAIRDRVLAYRFESGVPLVATADPTSEVVKANLHEALTREFRLTVTTDADLTTAIARAYGRQTERPARQPTLGMGGAPIRTSSALSETPLAPTSPTISAPAPPEISEPPGTAVPPVAAQAPVEVPRAPSPPIADPRPAEAARVPDAPVVEQAPVEAARAPDVPPVEQVPVEASRVADALVVEQGPVDALRAPSPPIADPQPVEARRIPDVPVVEQAAVGAPASSPLSADPGPIEGPRTPDVPVVDHAAVEGPRAPAPPAENQTPIQAPHTPTPPAAESAPVETGPEETAPPALAETPGGVVVPLWDGPLGALLVSSELLSSEQVEDALREAARRGRRLGEIVVERGWIHERTLANCLAGQKGLPFISLSETAVDQSAVRLFPEEIALRYGTLPVGFEGSALKLAISDPTNEAAMESIRAAVDVDIRFVVAAPSELASTLVKAYDSEKAASAPPPAESEPDEAEPSHRDPEPLDVALRESIPTAAVGAQFKVEVCLSHGERVDAGTFPSRAAAEARAKELVRNIAAQDPADWPLVNGRFLRPAMIVSVDVAESTRAPAKPPPTEDLG